MTNEELRELTGKVEIEDMLTHFLYLLVRDYLPAGIIEELVRKTEKNKILYTNGYLAKYAELLSNRLKDKNV